MPFFGVACTSFQGNQLVSIKLRPDYIEPSSYSHFIMSTFNIKRKETVTFLDVVEAHEERGSTVSFVDDSKKDENISEDLEIEPQSEVSSEEENEVEQDSEDVRNALDKLSDHHLLSIVSDMENNLYHVKLENNIFRYYLLNNDSSLLDGFQVLVDFAQGKGPPPPELTSDLAAKRSAKLNSVSIMSILDLKSPKINISHKSDMVTKATEEAQAKLESFLKKSSRIRRKLKSELEEFFVRESDVKEARDIFEYNIVTHGVDKLTQRIPAEKFIRYMEDWLKSATLNLEKLRLRTASLKVHYKKVCQTLLQRQELGENVHAVDFDQLEIENKHFITKIDQKNTHLLELKKMNGGANLVLSKHKKYLHGQQQECNNLKAKMGEHEKQKDEIERECQAVEEEGEKAEERLGFIKNLKNSYTVPDVMDYIKIKRELIDVRKGVKVWQRRKKIQEFTINACVRQMKNITGSSVVDPAWFEDPEDSDSSAFSLLNHISF